MPFEIIRADITELSVDAIVNSAHPLVKIGAGVDYAIHKKAGSMLFEARKNIGEIHTGEAFITKGYDLKAPYVIHTVGPIWEKGDFIEENQLSSCYLNSLNLALKYNLKSIAFPLISSGAFGCPKDIALRIALQTIQPFLLEHYLYVYLCVYDKESLLVSQSIYQDIKAYITESYVEEDTLFNYDVEHFRKIRRIERSKVNQLSYFYPEMEMTFSERLLKLVDQTGKKDAEIYHRVYMDRKLFSKIRSNPYYQPSKDTAILLAIALELNLDETTDLLKSAGYALSNSQLSDVIITYHITNKIYDIHRINAALFEFDQKLLG
jgi:O-acetyl-ADP-ribose deacetylase